MCLTTGLCRFEHACLVSIRFDRQGVPHSAEVNLALEALKEFQSALIRRSDILIGPIHFDREDLPHPMPAVRVQAQVGFNPL